MTLQVGDLNATVEVLRAEGAIFRHGIHTGVGVRTVLLDDPSGNPVELIQPTAGYHQRSSP
jgi:hypothetical protein